MEASPNPVTGLFPVVAQSDLTGRIASQPQQISEAGSGDFQRFASCRGRKPEDDQELQPAKRDRRPQSRTRRRGTGRGDAQQSGGQSDQGSGAEEVDQPEAGQEGADDRTQRAPGVDIADGGPGLAASRERQGGDDRGDGPHRRGWRPVNDRDLNQYPDRPADVRGRSAFENPLREPDDRAQQCRRLGPVPLG